MDVLESTAFILGPNVSKLEEEVADYIGTKHAVGVASGTDALHLALLAHDIGPGDEVITSPFTFIATAEAIAYCGAKPVFIDIEPDTLNMDPLLLKAALTKNTKAVLPVHLYGQCATMGETLEFAVTNGLAVIEDCAQSFGANYKFTRTGSFADAGCFSFFPSKNLGCYGDGGMITTDSDNVFERLKSLRNHGSLRRYYHDEIGYNSRLDEMQAAILRIKLKRIDTYNANRRKRAEQYNDLMKNLPGIVTPVELSGNFHVYHQYTIQADNRDAIHEALTKEGIASAVYYPVPLHLQDAFVELGYKKGDLPVCEAATDKVLSLPIYPELSEEDVELIVDVIRSHA
jgi:dTDP-4-amino-4,6-dideoxygalactose transaminase